jgi:hypothetical protein
MINCPKCNAELPDKAKFCITCGNKLTDAPPQGGGAEGQADDAPDKMSLLKQKLTSFKAKTGDPAGVYSTNGYKETYTLDRGTYNQPVVDDVVTPEDFTGGQGAGPAPQKVVMKPMGGAAQPLQQQMTIPLKAGHCYLIEENKPKFCFEIFSHYLKENYKGLSISRINPKRILEDFGIEEDAASLLWLTDSTTSDENTIAPSLERITYDIKAFINKNKEDGTPLIIFDGLEYLLSNNQFNPVIRFLRHLVDECSMSDSVMLIPLSPLAISQQELKMLEREFDVVERDK